jgi:hypothetical protein
MSNVQAKFASALFLGVAAGAMWTMVPQRAVIAADNCLTAPTDQTAQGQHWYYHIERGTGRHCWYLRGEDEKATRADTSVAAAPEKPAPSRDEATPSRSIADAHAEIPPRPRIDAPSAAPSVWPRPSSAPAAAGAAAASGSVPNAPSSPLASRWPNGSGAGASTGNQASASQQPPDASLMLADVQAADGGTNAAADAPQNPAPAAAPIARNTGSVQKLLLVAAGALALAGLTGSIVYRLGRRRRRNDWLRERTEWTSAQNPNSPPWVDPRFAHAHPMPDLDQARLAAQESDFELAMSEDDQTSDDDQTDERVEKIEEYLARLTRQLENEVSSSSAKLSGRDAPPVVTVASRGEAATSAVPGDASRRREIDEVPTSHSSFERRATARSQG